MKGSKKRKQGAVMNKNTETKKMGETDTKRQKWKKGLKKKMEKRRVLRACIGEEGKQTTTTVRKKMQ